jgi:dTMP kinase
VDPALRAGLVVLADRYRWTPMARAAARGVDVQWLETLFSFAPDPDLVFWLDVDVRTSLRRRDADPDAFEAGLDLGLSDDTRESYALYRRGSYRLRRVRPPRRIHEIPPTMPELVRRP